MIIKCVVVDVVVVVVVDVVVVDACAATQVAIKKTTRTTDIFCPQHLELYFI